MPILPVWRLSPLTATHLVHLKEGMLRFFCSSREPRFVWTNNDNAVSKFSPPLTAPLYSLLLDRCTNAATKRCQEPALFWAAPADTSFDESGKVLK